MQMTRKSWACSLLSLALLSVIPARAQKDTQTQQTADAHASASVAGTQKPATNDPNYVIGAQDVLDINIWKEPDLSRSVPVRPDGKISLPLLNDVQASGLTPIQLAAQITTGLNKYLTSPEVTVIVSQINSQRIYILGEVARAGAYTMIPGMTALQALSNAGGFTAFANPKKIYILRQENGKQVKLYFNYKEVIAGRQSDQNIELRVGDTIVVP
jgi:polysaccharide export outer membrane protein